MRYRISASISAKFNGIELGLDPIPRYKFPGSIAPAGNSEAILSPAKIDADNKSMEK